MSTNIELCECGHSQVWHVEIGAGFFSIRGGCCIALLPLAARLHVVVHYAAAEKPYREDAPRTQTVGELKALVLKAFGLSEGSGPVRTNVVSTLYYEKRALENLGETLGQVAGEREGLELKLVQQLTQGRTP